MKIHEPISDSRIRQIVTLIDLTNLNDDCNNAAIESLCAQARTSVGYVAAICIWPTFVQGARKFLGNNSPVKIATVVSFPNGDEALKTSCAIIETALDDGANEIDYVLPYKELINGNTDKVSSSVNTIRSLIPNHVTLKVILETGELEKGDVIRTAANIAINQGADFIKTSTGKVPVNATPEAAKIMLDAIRHSQRDVGFKAAGGIKTIDDANLYLTLSEERLGQHWADATHFRFGASSLLQDALNRLDIESSASSRGGDEY